MQDNLSWLILRHGVSVVGQHVKGREKNEAQVFELDIWPKSDYIKS